MKMFRAPTNGSCGFIPVLAPSADSSEMTAFLVSHLELATQYDINRSLCKKGYSYPIFLFASVQQYVLGKKYTLSPELIKLTEVSYLLLTDEEWNEWITLAGELESISQELSRLSNVEKNAEVQGLRATNEVMKIYANSDENEQHEDVVTDEEYDPRFPSYHDYPIQRNLCSMSKEKFPSGLGRAMHD